MSKIKPKTIIVTESQFYDFLREVTDSYFSKYDVYDFSEKNSLDFNENDYHKIMFGNDSKVKIEEGISKTYPSDVTINHVYDMMQGYDIEIFVPNEKQNDDKIANHIIVRTFSKEVGPKFELDLEKAFKACGYSLGATGYDNDSVIQLKLYQFEPMFQKDSNYNIGEHIYHVTTKNKLNNILKNGFTPKNSNKLGFMYDGRCYFFLGTDFVLQYIRRSEKVNKEYNEGNLMETNDYVLFEIKTENIRNNVKFYPDVNFPNGISIFTYANIPPSEITNYYLFKTE
jgi:hypothetical protein